MNNTVKSTGNKRLDWWMKWNAMKRNWFETEDQFRAGKFDSGLNSSTNDGSLNSWEKQQILCSLYL